MRRRCFLGSAAAAALNGRARAAGAPALGRVGYQLSWIKNFQFAGEYVAIDRGYYRAAGIDVDLLAGGPSLTVDPIVAAGRALVGQSIPDATANANLRGADLRVIGANYQRPPYCMISMARAPIRTPQDLAGKKIGMQASNLLLWRAFLKLNHIEPSAMQIVPVQFDFAPLIAGEVDGFFGYINDDVVHLRARGEKIAWFMLGDHGYNLLAATYTARASSLADKHERAQLVAFMRGDMEGWRAALADPALSARLTVDVYGKDNGLNLQTEQQACVASGPLIEDQTTRSKGLFWMSDEAVAQTIETLAAAGIRAQRTMFTNEILAEAHGQATL